MDIFKKIKLFYEFRKLVRSNKNNLLNDMGIRIDRANRLYTVVNVPPLEEPYNMRKSDVDLVTDRYITEYMGKLQSYLNSKIGIMELYTLYTIQRVEKSSYLVVVGFKYFNSVKYNNIVWLGVVPSLVMLATILILNLI